MPSLSSFKVNIIVPLAGYTDSLLPQLQSIISQTYPFSKLICVTEDKVDKAVPVILKLTDADQRIIHVSAGRTTSCSQKNHNLIAGLEHITADCDILVFCDAGHEAPKNLLENLLTPFHDNTSMTTSSGYHHVYPASKCLAIYCRAVCVSTLHMLRRIPFMSQPWGGATAVRLTDFKTMNVAKTWSSTIVDDVTLANLLQERGKKLIIPRNADTRTYIHSKSFSSMIDWLVRQIAYLKFIFPATWVFLGVALFLLSFGVYCSMATLLMNLFCPLPAQGLFFSTLYLMLFIIFSMSLRIYHPSPGAAAYWYTSCLLCPPIACWCHAKTWFSSKIYWGDTTYTVIKRGVVVGIERNDNR